MVLTLNQNQGRRVLRQFGNAAVQAQPLNTWDFTLQLTCVTNRGQEQDHQGIVGRVRWSLQYHRLNATWTETIAPYHSITWIQESQVENEVEDDEDCDRERLTFVGACNIRDSSWPA